MKKLDVVIGINLTSWSLLLSWHFSCDNPTKEDGYKWILQIGLLGPFEIIFGRYLD